MTKLQCMTIRTRRWPRKSAVKMSTAVSSSNKWSSMRRRNVGWNKIRSRMSKLTIRTWLSIWVSVKTSSPYPITWEVWQLEALDNSQLSRCRPLAVLISSISHLLLWTRLHNNHLWCKVVVASSRILQVLESHLTLPRHKIISIQPRQRLNCVTRKRLSNRWRMRWPAKRLSSSRKSKPTKS